MGSPVLQTGYLSAGSGGGGRREEGVGVAAIERGEWWWAMAWTRWGFTRRGIWVWAVAAEGEGKRGWWWLPSSEENGGVPWRRCGWP